MAQANINIRIDEEVKKQFDEICEQLGLTMSAAINIFAKTMIREQGMPFKVSLNSYNKETLEAIEDVENGRNLSKVYDNLEEMFEDLDA